MLTDSDSPVYATLRPWLSILESQHLLRQENTGDREWIELSHDRLIAPIQSSNVRWRKTHLSRLQIQSEAWIRGGKPLSALFSGAELEAAEDIEKNSPESLSDVDTEFLRASQALRKGRRRLRVLESGLGILLVIALVAVFQYRSAYQEIARNQRQLELVRATSMARDGRGPEALSSVIRTIDAVDVGDSDARFESDFAFTQVLGLQPPVLATLGSHTDLVRALAFSDDGKTLYSGGWDGSLRAWPLRTVDSPAGVLLTSMSSIYAIARHPGRKLMAVTDTNGRVVLWRVEDTGAVQVAIAPPLLPVSTVQPRVTAIPRRSTVTAPSSSWAPTTVVFSYGAPNNLRRSGKASALAFTRP